MSKRKKIKANRKPKITRDRGWKRRALQGDIDQELETPRIERVVPRGQQEDKVELWTRIEQELELEAHPPQEQKAIDDHLRQGVVLRVSTGLCHVDIDDQVIICSVRGTLSAAQTGYTNIVATGDRVLVSTDQLQNHVIERILPRSAVLARPDVANPDTSQIIVANVDQLLIVASWMEPDLWIELIDRALIAAHEGKMKPLICINKVDLVENQDDLLEIVAMYRHLGYTVLLTSAISGQGIDELREHLSGHETALTGLSGVGKSSLLMAVQPNLQLEVADVSDYSGQGRHTTTQVSLLKLDHGGYVVDTPGIRELGLIKVHRFELILYFPEIAALVNQCRFNDCTHTIEPGCAVLEAVQTERIPWSRYASYQSIYDSLPEYYTE